MYNIKIIINSTVKCFLIKTKKNVYRRMKKFQGESKNSRRRGKAVMRKVRRTGKRVFTCEWQKKMRLFDLLVGSVAMLRCWHWAEGKKGGCRKYFQGERWD